MIPISKKNDSSDVVKAYAIFSQGIASMIVLGALGFFIGWKVNKHSALCGILAVVGGVLGLGYFIMLVYKNHYFDSKPIDKAEEEKHEK